MWRLVLAACVVACAGCGDRCERLCNDVSAAVEGCASGPSVWGELGFASRRAFARDCRDDWNDEARFLGARELEQALGACADANAVLTEMGCEDVRAAWPAPPE